MQDESNEQKVIRLFEEMRLLGVAQVQNLRRLRPPTQEVMIVIPMDDAYHLQNGEVRVWSQQHRRFVPSNMTPKEYFTKQVNGSLEISLRRQIIKIPVDVNALIDILEAQ